MICSHGHDEGMIERLATPEEVDNGCELGVAFDPCPDCPPEPQPLDEFFVQRFGSKFPR